MFCDYCHGYGYHKLGCPLDEPSETDYICSICGECIQKGDEYLENDELARKRQIMNMDEQIAEDEE